MTLPATPCRVDLTPSSTQSWSAWLDANAVRYLLFARSQTRCEADAQDLLQEVLVEVWRRQQYRPPDDALVYKTFRRRAIDLARRTDRRTRREQATPEWWQPPDHATGDSDADLARAVQSLPSHFREVVLLKIWGGLTFRQIADSLDIPPGTAASRYRYALDALRQHLKAVRP